MPYGMDWDEFKPDGYSGNFKDEPEKKSVDPDTPVFNTMKALVQALVDRHTSYMIALGRDPKKYSSKYTLIAKTIIELHKRYF